MLGNKLVWFDLIWFDLLPTDWTFLDSDPFMAFFFLGGDQNLLDSGPIYGLLFCWSESAWFWALLDRRTDFSRWCSRTCCHSESTKALWRQGMKTMHTFRQTDRKTDRQTSTHTYDQGTNILLEPSIVIDPYKTHHFSCQIGCHRRNVPKSGHV